jgi:hypothetical protein
MVRTDRGTAGRREGLLPGDTSVEPSGDVRAVHQLVVSEDTADTEVSACRCVHRFDDDRAVEATHIDRATHQMRVLYEPDERLGRATMGPAEPMCRYGTLLASGIAESWACSISASAS